MILRRIYDNKLAQASYLVGCATTREALVVDPNRDADCYLRAAAAEGLTITQVTETHIHADFVSGSRDLARRAGARLLLSGEGDASWKYAFAADSGATLLHDGDTVRIGNVELRVMHTPGHTPEHLVFLVTDTAGASEPMGMLSGDFLFVGDVGRPDLLERAVKVAGTMEGAARALHRSLRRLQDLPDYLQIWPGHGAGSACGKALGAVPQTTLGYERRFNWAFAAGSQTDFVARALAGQPEPPTYFATMKRVNKEGPPPLDTLPRPPRLAADRLHTLLAAGATIVDLRPASDFAEGHVRGTINIPLDRAFPTWSGWLLRPDRDLCLLGDERLEPRFAEAVRDLALVGLDRVKGLLGADALAYTRTAQGGGGERPAWERTTRLPITERGSAAARGGTVLDVRTTAEFDAGHVPGAMHVPLGELEARAGELPDGPLYVHCQAGTRSAMAVSLLQALGKPDVVDLTGGYGAWAASGGAAVH